MFMVVDTLFFDNFDIFMTGLNHYVLSDIECYHNRCLVVIIKVGLLFVIFVKHTKN